MIMVIYFNNFIFLLKLLHIVLILCIDPNQMIFQWADLGIHLSDLKMKAMCFCDFCVEDGVYVILTTLQ